MYSTQVFWLDPDIFTHEIIWDNTSNTYIEKIDNVRNLMSKAFQDPLSQPEQQVRFNYVFETHVHLSDKYISLYQTLLAELDADPKMVHRCGITPKKLPALVENNPLIAIEVLLKLMNSSQITEYAIWTPNSQISACS